MSGVQVGSLLDGICMHERRAKRQFIVESIGQAHNAKTLIARGACQSCKFGMSKIISKKLQQQEAKMTMTSVQPTSNKTQEKKTGTEPFYDEGYRIATEDKYL